MSTITTDIEKAAGTAATTVRNTFTSSAMDAPKATAR